MLWLDAIRELGFAILPGLFSVDQMDRILLDVEHLSPPRSRAGIRHALHFEPVAALAQHPLLIELASGALGSEAFPFRATFFQKSREANWLVVWHQDTALPLRKQIDLPGWGPWSIKEGIDYAHAPASALSQVLALRVHFDDSTSSNGPLRVLPGTHANGVMSDDSIHEFVERVTPVDCIVPKGGVLAMRPLLVHASSKSQTDLPRRVLHIEYAASESIAAPLELAVS